MFRNWFQLDAALSKAELALDLKSSLMQTPMLAKVMFIYYNWLFIRHSVT